MSKVYIAAPWLRRERAIEAAAALEGAGIQITRKWWLYEDPAAGANGQGSGTLSLYATALAELDIKAVREADAVIALVAPEGGVGMWVECGAALALGKRVIAINLDNFDESPPRRSIFDNMFLRTTLQGAIQGVKFEFPG